MADPRFFNRAGPYSLGDLARIGEAELAAGSDPAALSQDVGALDVAGPDQVTFFENRRYLSQFRESKAGACVVHPDFADQAPAGMRLLISKQPYRSFALISQAFYPKLVPQPWVAPTAFIDASATLPQSCRVEHGAFVGANVKLGERCHVGVNAVIADGVVLGDDCVVGANSSISHSLIGNRVVIYPGACIGQDGFGFAMSGAGHLRVPQLGRVVIEDDVEIGANAAVDRGAGPDTVIGRGSMIDNLVQIGHNVKLGRGCVIAAQVGTSGSTQFGDFVVVGGQAGFAGHLKIGAGARVAAQSGVTQDIPAGTTVAGFPAVPAREHWRKIAALGQLASKNKANKKAE